MHLDCRVRIYHFFTFMCWFWKNTNRPSNLYFSDNFPKSIAVQHKNRSVHWCPNHRGSDYSGHFIWRRVRDSNPRFLSESPVFKTGSLNRSDNSPDTEKPPYGGFCGGVRGIWTLARLLTAYSLSRGAPSASWVSLRIKSIFLCCLCILAQGTCFVKRKKYWLFRGKMV